MKRFIALLSAVAVCAALALTGCAEQETYVPSGRDAAIPDASLVTPGTITVGVDTSQGKAPLAGISTAGRVVGLDVDLSVWLADELGLKVTVVDVADDPVGALADGTVDIVMGLSADEEGDNLWKSNIYIPTGVVLFSLDSEAEVPADDAEVSISAEAAKISAWAVANEFGAEALVAGESMGEVFEMLRDGSVDFAAADALIGLYAANTVHCDAYVIALMQESTGYCIGARADNTAVQQAVASALLKVSGNGILDRIVEDKWLGKSLDLSDVPYTELALRASSDDEDGESGEDEGEAEEA